MSEWARPGRAGSGERGEAGSVGREAEGVGLTAVETVEAVVLD